MANESPNEFFTQAAWTAMWTPTSDYYLPNVIKNGINKDGVNVDPLGNLTVGQVPPSGSIQLMESHDLATWLPVKTGYVGIVFNNVLATNLAAVANGGLTYTDVSTSQGNIVAVVNIPQIQITGDYTLVATGLAQCALDTAAILPGGLKTGMLKANGEDVTNDDRLNAARDQRTRLWQTPNGGQFMDSFYDHNEVYNYAFQNNGALQNSWSKPVNQGYMNTTYGASQNPSTQVVNPQSADNDNETTYNQNAGNQKLAVAYAAMGYSIKPPSGTNITPTQFSDAAWAAQNFAGVVGQTGNTTETVVPMTVDQVYDTIKNSNSQTVMMKANAIQYPRDYDGFMASLSDKEREYLELMEHEAAQKALMAASNDASATLMQGTFHIVISGGTLTLGAGLTFASSGSSLTATANVTSFTSALQISSVAIDNQPGWLGLKSIGQAVIDAYNNSGQIASLMQDKANAELESDTVKNYIGTWLNNTLQKLLGDF
jgi:hypothetical protein